MIAMIATVLTTIITHHVCRTDSKAMSGPIPFAGKESAMIVTVISVAAGVVTIVTGVLMIAEYIQRRRAK